MAYKFQPGEKRDLVFCVMLTIVIFGGMARTFYLDCHRSEGKIAQSTVVTEENVETTREARN